MNSAIFLTFLAVKQPIVLPITCVSQILKKYPIKNPAPLLQATIWV